MMRCTLDDGVVVEVDRVQEPITNGWASRASALRLAAHGRDREIADLNLQRVIRAYFAPFRRRGTLEREIEAAGLTLANVESD